MTTPVPPPASDSPRASPDTLAQIASDREVALINARASLKNARWGAVISLLVALLALAGNLFQGIHSSSHTSASTPLLTLGPFSAPDGDSNIGWTVNLRGPVSGLTRGQMIWTFNEPLKTPGIFYPDTGPCSVSSSTWTCNGVHIGTEGKAGLGTYRIWAVVVGESDAFNIVTDLRCFPSGIPSIRGVTLEPACTDTFSSLPGKDIIPPQYITVTRTG